MQKKAIVNSRYMHSEGVVQKTKRAFVYITKKKKLLQHPQLRALERVFCTNAMQVCNRAEIEKERNREKVAVNRRSNARRVLHLTRRLLRI